MAAAYQAYREGRLDDFYAPLVVDDSGLDAGIAAGEYVVDIRLRDRLRTLGFDERAAAAPTPAMFEQPDVRESAAFAGEYSALLEADLGVALGNRVDALEVRVGELERGMLSRMRSALESLR